MEQLKSSCRCSIQSHISMDSPSTSAQASAQEGSVLSCCRAYCVQVVVQRPIHSYINTTLRYVQRPLQSVVVVLPAVFRVPIYQPRQRHTCGPHSLAIQGERGKKRMWTTARNACTRNYVNTKCIIAIAAVVADWPCQGDLACEFNSAISCKVKTCCHHGDMGHILHHRIIVMWSICFTNPKSKQLPHILVQEQATDALSYPPSTQRQAELVNIECVVHSSCSLPVDVVSNALDIFRQR